MSQILETRSGRPLEFQEYGDPDGHPILFFHGLIGSHLQAAYVADEAGHAGFRVIAPNRPGVGRSAFVERNSALEAVPDVEDLTASLGVDDFSVIGISGGTPYALACLLRLAPRIRTVTILSGMGPTRLPGALRGMERRRRLAVEIGSRYPNLARQEVRKWAERFKADPRGFLRYLVSTWCEPDRRLFEREDVFNLFLGDLEQVLVQGSGPETFAQDLALYRNYGFSPAELPSSHLVTLWHGLDDVIVPPAMGWKMATTLPRCEAHFVPGGHFVAISIADRIIAGLRKSRDESLAGRPGGVIS
ncbi:Alpha/beta hydrolase family protein [Aquisphaera giovannonii]|uniref:Alpha/beta hydrolase family protein n=1 Tax=Aquisphaera giovannonii TaxID=406548 RepID=A0A5B9VZ87_9BACT|nr:alpha/beta fold hydrolase [Aquisphaera giovannonii]QEH33291.1 Alpha/beta hydrolase family protein [Aquisphaera giovannonii]